MATNIFSQQINVRIKDEILKKFETRVRDQTLNTGLLLIHSDSLNVHWKTAAHHDSAVFVNPDQPYHFASIGKTVTSVLISILYEKGLIDFEDKISKYLDDHVLNGLHILKGVDYSHELKIKHLLGHTSGLPDYYMDKNNSKVRLLDLMISQPGRFWSPMETIDWSKKNLKPKFKPGKGFHYSDTNYQLLGLIIEKITGTSLHEALHRYIFGPLGMDNTYLIFYSEPKTKSRYPMVDLHYADVNLSQAKSISMSWASGGIVSTSEDMLKFHKAIVESKIVRKETFEKMCNFSKMGPGLFYGYGIMNFRFMFMPEKYHIWGNSGSIGAFMYYNPAMDIYVIGSFHKVNYQRQPIFYICSVLRIFKKELNKLKQEALYTNFNIK